MTEKRYRTPQGDIHYWLDGQASAGPSLIFLPGLTADHRLFQAQTEHFRQSFRLLVWDAPGHNASRPFSQDYSLADKARWLREIMLAEGLEDPVLIGQSMGGYVSQCFMQLYPGVARGFISIDSAPIKRRYISAAELWIMRNAETMYRLYPWQALIRAGAEGCAETEAGRRLMAEMMSGYDREDYVRLVGHGYRILARAIEADLPYKLYCQSLLICGERDRAGATKRYNLEWARCEGLPLRLIPNAGHNSNTDAPDAVNRAIEQFLGELAKE